MKNIFYYFLFLVSFNIYSQSGNTIVDSIKSNNTFRQYRLYIPSNYTGTTPIPLIINLHGYTSNATQQQLYSNFMPIADTAGFLMVYPQGVNEPNGYPFWNAGLGSISYVNDTLFLNQLIDSLSLLYNIDLNKVFMTGLSNGGFMSHYMACFCNRKITAIASVAGTFFTFWPVCNPGKIVPMMHIHGTSDPTVPYYGNSTMLSADSTVKRWVQKNGCNPVASYSLVPDINTSDASTAEHYRFFINGNTKSIVEFFKINNGAHTWPGSPFIIGTTNQDINASAEIWRFFRQFSANDFTNISSLENENVIYKVFPNPTQSSLNIISNEIINSIKIIDIAGKTIFSDSYSFPTKFLKLEISNFEKGVYLIVINNQSHIKFIKN